MRILGFSDIHRDTAFAREIVEHSRNADVVVGAGDFGVRGIGTLDALHVLSGSHCPVVVVHGNHDRLDELEEFATCRPTIHLLHGTSVTIQGKTFFGFGGEVPPRSLDDWNSFETEEAAAGLLAPMEHGAVLVTHTPPLGQADRQRDGTHEGSRSIRDSIAAAQPCLALCGHIHNAWGTTGAIATTPVHNLGPRLNWFTL